MTHGEHYLAGKEALLVVVLWSSCCSGGCPHTWIVFSVYLIVLSQGRSLNVSAERLPIKAGVSLFCISAHLTNIFTFLEHCFPWIPRLCATAAVLTPPKPHLQRDLEVCALCPSQAALGSVGTHCEPPRQWCCASSSML